MKKLLIILFILTPSVIWAQSGKKDGSFNAAGIDQLYIMIDAGMKINVTGTDTDQISYTYEFDGNDQAYEHYFQNFNPEYETYDGRASLQIDFPEIKRKNVSFRTKKHLLTLSVPKAIELQLQTRYSTVNIQSIERATEVTNRSGSVAIRDIGQGIKVSNEYGNVVAENINGDVDISSRSARIDVKGVKGSLTVKSHYTKLNLTKITGELDLENKSGTVNAYDLDSRITSRGDYTNYELTDIRGDIDIDTKSGSVIIDKAENVNITGDYTNVTASNLKGERGISINTKSSKVQIENVFGDVGISGEYINIELENISRHVDVRNRSGKVTTNTVQGAVSIVGEYNKIDVKNYQGDYVYILNRSGNIQIEAMEKLNSLEVWTSYGDVDVNMKKPFEGDVRFDVEYGKLDQPFKLNNTVLNNSRNAAKVQGKVGNGTGRILIEVRNGDITITQ